MEIDSKIVQEMILRIADSKASKIDDAWFSKEIHRCLRFLDKLQTENLQAIKGGFVHSLHSHEARLDVAGHVFNGLCLLLNASK